MERHYGSGNAHEEMKNPDGILRSCQRRAKICCAVLVRESVMFCWL